MERSARVRSLAKVNLDVRVLGARADGYHELRTVFQTVSLADRIQIEYSASRRSELSIDSDIPNNLVTRAAEALLARVGKTARVRFRLQKRIPMGAGLGGGSSNAAAVLLALPALAGWRLSLEDLMELAAGLGSDVPFFLMGGAALGLGRGTEIYPLPDLARSEMLLVSPGVHISTPDAYRALDAKLTSGDRSCKLNSFQAFVRRLVSLRRAEAGANDFETVVFSQYPQLRRIQGKLLRLGASGSRMTGSGSALFGLFLEAGARDRAAMSFGGHAVHAARLVSRASYRRLWRRQLGEHVTDEANPWPPQSRYAR